MDVTPKNEQQREGGEKSSQFTPSKAIKKHISIGNETSVYESQNSHKIDRIHIKNIITPESENLKKYKEAEDK